MTSSFQHECQVKKSFAYHSLPWRYRVTVVSIGQLKNVYMQEAMKQSLIPETYQYTHAMYHQTLGSHCHHGQGQDCKTANQAHQANSECCCSTFGCNKVKCQRMAQTTCNVASKVE